MTTYRDATEEACYLSAAYDHPRQNGEPILQYLERLSIAAQVLLARKAQPHEAHEWRGEL